MVRGSTKHTLPRWVPVAIAAMAFGCTDGTGPGGATVRAQLIRLQGSGASASAPAGIRVSGSPPVSGYAWSSAVTIDAFRVPIRAIVLRSGNTSAEVYRCAADTNDGCLVDLAGPALQDLLGATPATVRAGTYTAIEIYTCGEEGSYHGFLTGSVALAGSSWVTRVAGVLDSIGTAEPVQLEYSGCARSYPLPSPLVIGDSAGAPVALKLYFDMRDLAWASLGANETAGGWIPGGCAGPRPGSSPAVAPFLCTGYPDVAGVVDSLVPTVERYRINEGATIGLIFKASTGEFVGGFSRRYFEHGVASNPGFNADTPVNEWVANGDGTYLLSTFGGSGPGGMAVGHYFSAPAFQRADHSGTATPSSGVPFTYVAVRIE
jgi:hypothetical protein